MARFAAILLALSLAAGGALAASPEAVYLAARDKAIAETLTSIRRAGASIILTYWATEVARKLH